MKKRYVITLAAFTLAIALPTFASNTPKGGIIYTFKGASDGNFPAAALVADAQGNLYGTTEEGGSTTFCRGYGCGIIFELIAPSSPSGTWREIILHSFTGGSDGSSPASGLIFDSAGNLYGTTASGGDLSNMFCTSQSGQNIGCGTVFELSPPTSPGGVWTETVLHMFEWGSTDGAFPQSSLVFDGSGNLFGTTVLGNLVSDGGVVFELSPLGGGAWTESILYSFTGLDDGGEPYGRLTFDGFGNLYGTTAFGGDSSGDGVVFQLVPPVEGGPWIENSILIFDGSDGANPFGGVLIDPSGNLFGSTMNGGVQKDGVSFELVPPQSGGVWTEVILRSFIGGGNAHPFGFVEDGSGDLYGTTEGTYADTCGEIFKLSHSAGEWNQTVLHSFSGKHFSQGCFPEAPLVYGKWKALYGTTSRGGDKSCGVGCGTVFGFLP